MPYLVQRVQSLTHFSFPYTYKTDLGSVLFFDTGTFRNILHRKLSAIGPIIKGHWVWFLGEDAIGDTEDPSFSPTDYRNRLYMNFASADDAMLVRISVTDLVKVDDVNGRRRIGEAEEDL